MFRLRPGVPVPLAAAATLAMAGPALSQDAPRAQEAPEDSLAALVAEALDRNPGIAAAERAVDAAHERISQAGAWQDPQLTLGFQDLRTDSFDFGDDFMTMKVVQLSQRLPIPGKLGAHRDEARHLAEAEAHAVDAARVEVAAQVKEAYAELYYTERALALTERNLAVLEGIQNLSLTRYATGAARQPDPLRAGIEIAALEERSVELREARRAAAARLNATLDRPAGTPVEAAPFPSGLGAIALGPRGEVSFAAAGVTDRDLPGLPPLDSLIVLATRRKPDLRAHVALIAADEAAVRAARRNIWPDPHISVGYGQRENRPDMMSATISLDLPIFAGAKRNAAVREAEARLAGDHAMHAAMVNEIEREVTDAYARLRDVYERLAILAGGSLRRARANLEASLGAYRSGGADFLTLLDAQVGLYDLELRFHRGLADFVSAWAALERAVGEEIEP